MTKCPVCDKECQQHSNYCSWDCHVEACRRDGGVAHQPNGLPIKCIKHDGTMYEHEHGDHPDYQYPVKVLYTGPIDDDIRHDYPLRGGKEGASDEQIRAANTETHALIYTDGSVAITMYECCYAMWYLRTGEFGGGSLWKSGNWKLDISSLRLPVKEPSEGSDEPNS